MVDDVFGIVGTQIGGAFRVDAVVAEGGFAVVYRAHHTGFRAPVALKCLKVPQDLDTERRATFLEQFRAEAEMLFRLSASISTVVRPLHVDVFNGARGQFVPFMALEWLDGETLDAIIRRRGDQRRAPHTLTELMELLAPVAEALDRAHHFTGPDGAMAIVHRDIKPENIFVAHAHGERIVKILDYGIAKAKSVASQIAGRASRTGESLSSFTPAYGAPEQWLPKRFGQTGPWTDVWGLALTLVEALAGRPVIDGDQAAMMGTALDPNRRPSPRTEGVQVNDAVESVFLRALALDPRERYRDAGQFWAALHAAVRGAPVSEAVAEVARPFGVPEITNLGETLIDPNEGLGAQSPRLDLELEAVEPVPSRRSGGPSAQSASSIALVTGPTSDHRVPSASPREAPPPHTRPSDAIAVASSASAPAGSARDPLAHPSAPTPSLPTPSPRRRVPYVAPPPSLLRELTPAAVLVGCSVIATVVNQAYAASTGELLALGPVRGSWVAALLLLAGLGHGAAKIAARRG